MTYDDGTNPMKRIIALEDQMRGFEDAVVRQVRLEIAQLEKRYKTLGLGAILDGKIVRCALCLRMKDEVRKMIKSGGTGAHICGRCVAECVRVLEKEVSHE